MDDKSIFFYLWILVLAVAVFQALLIGGLFFLKRSGEKRANFFFGALLITFGLTLLHNVLDLTGFFEEHQKWYSFPIYYTLAFPTLLFYYVKLNLYPSYRFRWTDLKHFVLPIFQWMFFVFAFLAPAGYEFAGRRFLNPFYGAIEQALYLTTFFAYLYFSYRYIRQKTRQVKDAKEAKKVLYLKILVQVLFLLFCIHSVFVVSEFVIDTLLHVDLGTVKPYMALGVLSFAALIFWLGIYGFQVLFWGKKIFKTR